MAAPMSPGLRMPTVRTSTIQGPPSFDDRGQLKTIPWRVSQPWSPSAAGRDALPLEFSALVAALALFAVAMVAGALNALSGGGTFLVFPSLLLAGVPAISANA